MRYCLLSGFVFFLAMPAAFASPPCAGMNLAVSEAERQAWEPAITAQLNQKRPETRALAHVDHARLLGGLHDHGWRILFVDTGVSDEGYLF